MPQDTTSWGRLSQGDTPLYIIIGRTRYADFLEQIIGYIFGLLFLGIGFWRWIPAIIALRAEEIVLRRSQEELKREVAELTAERNKLKTIIECEHAKRDASFSRPETE